MNARVTSTAELAIALAAAGDIFNDILFLAVSLFYHIIQAVHFRYGCRGACNFQKTLMKTSKEHILIFCHFPTRSDPNFVETKVATRTFGLDVRNICCSPRPRKIMFPNYCLLYWSSVCGGQPCTSGHMGVIFFETTKSVEEVKSACLSPQLTGIDAQYIIWFVPC